VDHHFELVADVQFTRVDGERKLAEAQKAFGLAADVHQQFVLIFRDDDPGEDLALVKDLETLFVEPLFKRELVFGFVRLQRSMVDGGNE
jgi:hypothetical protein